MSLSDFRIFASRADHGVSRSTHGAPCPDNSYGSPGEESQQWARSTRGTKGSSAKLDVGKGTPKHPRRQS